MLWNEIQQFHREHRDLLSAWRSLDDDKKGPKGPHCWGGILVMRLEGVTDPRRASVDQRFPHPHTLTEALRQANPLLKPKKARRYARRIIWRNDEGKFAAAADILRNALEFGQPRPVLKTGLIDQQLAEIFEKAGERKFTLA